MFQTILVYSGVMLLMFFFAEIISSRFKTKVGVRYHHQEIASRDYAHSQPFWSLEMFCLIIVFIFFFGVRYDVGVDHLTYLDGYLTGDNINRYEPVFLGITVAFRDLNIHFVFYFALLAFLQIFFILYSIKDEQYLLPFLVLSLFMGQFFWHWMNGIRQDVAACIYVFAVQFIVERKPLKFLFFTIIAIGFHKSSILLLLTYPILCRGKDLTMNRFWQLLLLFFTAYLAIIHFDVLTRFLPIISTFIELLEFEVYSENALIKFGEMTNTGLSLYAFLFLDALIILWSNKLKAYYNSKKFIIYYNLYYWGMILQLFLTNNMVLARPVRFFRCFKLLMIAYFLNYLYTHAKSQKNVFVFVLSMGLLLILFAAIIVNEPYYFFWGRV